MSNARAGSAVRASRRPSPREAADEQGGPVAFEQLVARGDALHRRGDHRGALAAYNRALAVHRADRPERATVARLLKAIAETAYAGGMHDVVVRALADTITRCANLRDPKTYLRLGQSRLELGQRDAAADDLLRAHVLSKGAIFEGEDPRFLEFLTSRFPLD